MTDEENKAYSSVLYGIYKIVGEKELSVILVECWEAACGALSENRQVLNFKEVAHERYFTLLHLRLENLADA